MNLEQYDEWKDTDAVYWAILFLDAVMEDFITKTENYKYLESAHNFAKRHRALGLGVMGYHSYLQKNMIPFESWEAKQFNAKVSKQLYIESRDASIELAELLGPAPIFNELSHKEDMEDVVTLMRNTTVLAIAPTTSSSSILGQVSPGIEPYSSNYFKASVLQFPINPWHQYQLPMSAV
jgi:ribonucleoside-diphosphate reductase alpha chain